MKLLSLPQHVQERLTHYAQQHGVSAAEAVEQLLGRAAHPTQSGNFFERSPDMLAVLNLQGNAQLMYVNPSFLRTLGFEETTPIAQQTTILVRDVVHPDDYQKTVKAFDHIRQHGSARDVMLRMVRTDGTTIWTNWNGFASRDGYTYVFGRDITATHCLEDALRFAVEADLAADEGQFLRDLVRYLTRALDVEYAFVGKLVPEAPSETLHMLAFAQRATLREGMTYTTEGTPCGQVVDRVLCTWPRAVQAHFPTDKSLAKLKAESYLGVPLWQDGQCVGILTIMDTRPLRDVAVKERVLQALSIRAAQALDRLRAAEALERSEMQYRTLFENAPVGILVTNNRGIILTCNAAFKRVLGYETHDLVGTDVFALVPRHLLNEGPDGRQRFIQRIREANLLQGLEMEALTASGQFKKIEVSIQRVSLGTIHRTIVFVSDLSEREKARQSRREAQALQQALQRERELRELQQYFVQTVSHEYRTPLSVIMTSSAVAKRYAEGTERGAIIIERLERIDQQCRRLTRMVRDVTDIGDQTPRNQQLQYETFDSLAALREALADAREVLESADIRVDFAIGPRCEVIRTDRLNFKRIASALLNNALKYSHAGGAVRVELHYVTGRVEMNIHDEGLGIAPDDQERIREIFQRGENVAHIPGSGLGLTVVQRTLELLGGHLLIESTLNVGTTMTVVLPQVIDGAGQTTAQAQRPSAPAPGEASA